MSKKLYAHLISNNNYGISDKVKKEKKKKGAPPDDSRHNSSAT